jgi:hypothetical protein
MASRTLFNPAGILLPSILTLKKHKCKIQDSQIWTKEMEQKVFEPKLGYC